MTETLPFSEEVLFTVLSHPLRRKILKTIYENRALSSSEMSDWGIKPGTLYFHLKELDGLISQNEDKKYILTTEGKEVCKWFIGTPKEAKIIKYDSYTLISRKLLHAVFSNTFLQVLLFLMFGFAHVIAYQSNLLLIGPFVISSELSPFASLVFAGMVFILQAGVLVLLMKIFSRSDFSFVSLVYHSISTLILSHAIIYLSVILVWTIQPFGGFYVGELLYAIMIIISQVYAGFVVTGNILRVSRISGERAVIVALFLIYLDMILLLAYLI